MCCLHVLVIATADRSLYVWQMQEAAANAIPEGLAWEESAGISAPLLDIVDVLFNLSSHGFFRRQV